MNKSPFVRAWFIGWIVATCFFSGAAFAQSPPNILFVFLDDFGWKDTGFMGSDFYETPNLDALANQSMVFTNAYSCAANCAPARACLLSGQYTPRHRIYNVGTKPRGKAAHRRLEHIPGVDVLDPATKTWAHQIKAAGYRTGTFGKWHLSDDPLPYGFDVNIGGTRSGSPPRGYYPPHNKVPGLEQSPADEYLTDRLTDEAIQFIRKSKDQPWLVYLTHFAVHTPIQAKKSMLPKYKAKQPGELHDSAAMGTMIEAVDQGVGKIQKVLDELDVAKNTITIFFSDNGGYGPITDMDPLKGYKGAYYEGGIRVPFFVHWPGVVKAGKTDETMIGVDLYRTLCAMAGASTPKDQPLDGVDLLPFLRGDVDRLEGRALFWHFPAYLQSYGKLADEQRDPLFRSRPCSIIRKGDWKLHQYFEDGGVELYNLKEDIGESHNLANSQPERVSKLLAELGTWQKEVKAAIPSRPNPAFDAAAETEAIEKFKRKKK